MIVNCEECGKFYSVDVSKMMKNNLKTRCTQCGNLMMINRNRAQAVSSADSSLSSDLGKKEPGSKIEVLRDETGYKWYHSIGFRLIFTFLSCVALIGITLIFLYVKQIPPLIAEQISLRGYSLSRSMGQSILQPLLLRNYLNINQIAKLNAELPGIAYVTVLNDRGILVSGIIGAPERFSSEFQEQYQNKGFPWDLPKQNSIQSGATESAKDLIVGGRKIHDVAMTIGDSAGTVHVGLFVEEIEREIRKGLVPMMILLAVLAVGGALGFIVIARNIVGPILDLANTAKRIGVGEIDEPVKVKGQGEIAELSNSIEMMRLSIKSAIYRLRNRAA